MRWERTAAAGSAAPPERVWEVLADGRRWSLWYDGVEWLEFEGPLQRGTIATIKPRRAPQTAFRIETLVPGSRLRLLLTIGPVAALRLGWEIEPLGAGSSILQTVAIDGLLAGPLLAPAARRIADAAPANLQRLAERAAGAPG